MPKIDLTFDEFLDIVSVLDVWANEIKDADMAEAKKLLDLSQAEAIYADTDSVRLHPDADWAGEV